jgi:hypothetical protein
MLRSINDLQGLTISASDGEIGTVDQFFFDDQHWSLRYMVVNTGNWLLEQPVLISPQSIRTVNWDQGQVEVNLTRQQVQDAPSTEMDRPVSRQMELEHAAYYNYDPYWYGPGFGGGMAFPYYSSVMSGYLPGGMTATEHKKAVDLDLPKDDIHLRSTREVTGYHIHAIDGEIGHIADFIMDDATWAIRYLVIDTRNWWAGKHVLVAPAWITGINWNDRMVDADLTRTEIMAVPEYNPEQLNRRYEERLYSHYKRTAYWAEASQNATSHHTPVKAIPTPVATTKPRT